MAENTAISWATHTFSPWVGCEKISPACTNCYAEAWAKRTGKPQLWQGTRRRTTPENWKGPLKWNKQAERDGTRPRVFCSSLADIFDKAADPAWRTDLFRLIRETPHLDWLILSKRIGNAVKMLPADWGDGYPNVWLGATIANQAEADRDVPKLLATPARVRFLSCEPLLGPVNIGQYLWECCGNPTMPSCFDDVPQCCGCPDVRDQLHWVIAGGESGGKARPSHPDWFRGLRDDCAAAGVPLHFKQWGEFIPFDQLADQHFGGDGEACADQYLRNNYWTGFMDRKTLIVRVGKKSAGRTLDGVIHDAFPEVPR